MPTATPVRILICVTLAALLAGCKGETSPPPAPQAAAGTSRSASRPTVAYVTNGIASFWTIAEVGAKTAGKDFDAEVLVRMPPSGEPDQRRMIEELLALGVDGMAVSPIDAENQVGLLNQAAERTTLITHDSDAPKSKRLAYIGMNNYTAGRMCGQLVKEAMPEGGTVMIFVGRLEQDNARLRRQGVIDELLDRSEDDTRFDPPGQALKGEKYTILDTRTDNFDFGAAKALPEDAIARYPDLGCMVGLFAYNPPYILEALRGAGKLGKIRVVAFDEADETLAAIQAGHCYGTVVQNPYMYGYKSVEVLAKLARGDKDALPAGGYMEIPARKITKENVDEFWADLKEKTSKK
jgi:ribose transport system substrate-binding protein